MKRKILVSFSITLLILLLAAPLTALAAVWTDKPDYSPGEVVTISGDNRDSAGYLPGEVVIVSVTGPNGYTATCQDDAVDENGAWSCQVTLWANDYAVGDLYLHRLRTNQRGGAERDVYGCREKAC